MPADLKALKQDLTRRMDGALDTLKREFSGLRTGRAHPGLLEPVKVIAYGQEMPLNQVGTIGAPEARMLTVQVWDKSMVSAVEKAIREAGIGLNPSTDGMLVRVPIPQLTTERRNELAKMPTNTPKVEKSPSVASAATAWNRSRDSRKSMRSARTSPRPGPTRCRNSPIST